MTRAFRVVVLLALAGATIVSLRYAVYLPLVCEANVTRALDALANAADRGVWAKETAAQYAESSLRGCECLERTDFKLDYVRGIAHRYQGDPRLAIDAYRGALALDRRPEIYIDLGLAQLDAVDRPAAMESFIAAGAFAPAVLDRIPYDDVRTEAERRIRAAYGDHWLP